MKNIILISTILIIFISCNFEEIINQPTSQPIIEPTYTPTPTPLPGEIWSEPDTIAKKVGDKFKTELYLNSGTEKVGAFGFSIKYDQNLVEIDKETGNSGIELKIENDLIQVNTEILGDIFIGGYDYEGINSGFEINIINIYWKAIEKGECLQLLTIDYVSDVEGEDIGEPGPREGMGSKVIVE